MRLVQVGSGWVKLVRWLRLREVRRGSVNMDEVRYNFVRSGKIGSYWTLENSVTESCARFMG